MIFYDQLETHCDVENGIYGDCYRTCVACFLEIEPQNIPAITDPDLSKYENELNDWLIGNYDLCLIGFPFKGLHSHEETMKMFQEFFKLNIRKDMPYIFVGNSPRDICHAVIAENGKIIHDPHPAKTGITGPSDGFYWIIYLVKAFKKYK